MIFFSKQPQILSQLKIELAAVDIGEESVNSPVIMVVVVFSSFSSDIKRKPSTDCGSTWTSPEFGKLSSVVLLHEMQ